MDLFKEYMPRAACMAQEPEMIWNYFISNALIAVAYFMIPIMIQLIKRNYEKRTGSTISFHYVFTAFKLFITLCGLTHVMDCIMIWHAMYLINIILLYVTAVVSVITGIILIKIFLPITHSLIAGSYESELNKNLKELIQIKKHQMI